MGAETPQFRPNAIREILNAEGISLAEFARRMRVSRQRAHVWMRGRASPQFPVVILMANEYGRSLAFFAEGLTNTEISS